LSAWTPNFARLHKRSFATGRNRRKRRGTRSAGDLFKRYPSASSTTAARASDYTVRPEVKPSPAGGGQGRASTVRCRTRGRSPNPPRCYLRGVRSVPALVWQRLDRRRDAGGAAEMRRRHVADSPTVGRRDVRRRPTKFEALQAARSLVARWSEAVRPIPGTVGVVVGPVADDHDRSSMEVGELPRAA
jgi:hypothetical protein